jgi:hypothetical protein
LNLRVKDSIELSGTNYGNPRITPIYETSNMLALPCADCPQNKVLVGKGCASQRTTCLRRQIDASFRCETHFVDSRTSAVRTNIDVAMNLPAGNEVVCATHTCVFLHLYV